MTRLEDIQAWFQAQLIGKANGQLLEEDADQLIKSNGFAPAQRLRVYATGYYLRLLECLQGDFPMLREFLTDEVFGFFAKGYIYSVGSQSYSLLDFSQQFPAFMLRMTPPAQDEETWQQYRFPYELACIERLLIETATAPGFENMANHGGPSLLQGSVWLGIRDETPIQTPACLRLMEANFDLCAFMDDPVPLAQRGIPPLCKTYLALSRRNYRIHKTILEPWQYHLLRLVAEGSPTLGAALEKIPDLIQKPVNEIRADLLFFLPFCEQQQLLSITN